MSITHPSPVPHPVDLVEEDLAESRKLLAGCIEPALDLRAASVNVRLAYIAAATRLLRHNALAAALLLREAHTCIRDMQRRPKPPPSMRRPRRPEDGDRDWFIDNDAELRAEADKILKTTSAGANLENSKTTSTDGDATKNSGNSKTTSGPAVRVA